jgi:hypothetical protein
MQISTATVLASQQQARAHKPEQPAGFEPLDFKQTAKAPAEKTAEAAAPAGYVRPGTHIDIKV